MKLSGTYDDLHENTEESEDAVRRRFKEQLERARDSSQYINICQEVAMYSRFVNIHLINANHGRDEVQLHSHTFYEMIYVLSGTPRYLLEGRSYNLHRGDLVIIPPGVSHRPLIDEQMSEPYNRIIVWFSQEYLDVIKAVWPDTIDKQWLGVLRTVNTEWSKVESILKWALYENTHRMPNWKSMLCATVLEALVLISRARDSIYVPSPVKGTPDLFDSLSLYIINHLTEDISLESAAQQLFVSKSTVDQLCRKKLGISFYRYLTQCRLLAAKELILKGEPLGTIFTKVGYTDYSTFYRSFKREYGITPSDFREFNRG